MGKGTGLIGNFKGKVGNTVGYKISASNTGNTQGIRVYQPIVKNPKTSAQAEQRAKLAPINATYRALKMVIDRGNESLPYGNKSRLAWLKTAFKAEAMPWFVKGATVAAPVICQLTKGSLPFSYSLPSDSSSCHLVVNTLDAGKDTTVGKVSTKIIAQYPQIKDGDQLTFVSVIKLDNVMTSQIDSFIVDSTSEGTIPSGLLADDGNLEQPVAAGVVIAGAIILSRQGDNGEHLRSTTSLVKLTAYPATVLTDDAKLAAIASYQNSANGNADWAEESIQ